MIRLILLLALSALALPAGADSLMADISTQFPEPQRPAVTVSLRPEPAALGITFRFDNGLVLRVDPVSTASGIIYPGDYLIAEDGLSPMAFRALRKPVNDAGTIVTVTYRNGAGIHTLPVVRKPISSFAAGFANGLPR